MKILLLIALIGLTALASASYGGGSVATTSTTIATTTTSTTTTLCSPLPYCQLDNQNRLPDGSQLKCSDGTLNDRIKCRLELPEERNGTTKLFYIPEECRDLQEPLAKAKCLSLYDSLQKCRKLSQEQRWSCARQQVGLKKDYFSDCRKLSGNEKINCIKEVKEKVFTGVKWRLYDLEEKAEEYEKKGISEDTVVSFIEKIELAKKDFNNSQTIAAKKEVVLKVKGYWVDFLKQTQKEMEESKV